MKKLAVLLSSYNGEKYIKEQIESILSQQLVDYQLVLIIRDDGSKDGTVNIIKEVQKNNPNIDLIIGNNIGFVASFFELMKRANNNFDYYALSDQDDVWKKDKLQRAIDKLEKYEPTKVQLYQAASLPVDEHLHPLSRPYCPKRKQTLYNTIIQNISAGHTYVFNQALLDKALDGLDVNQIYMHDSFLTNIAEIFHGLHYDPFPSTLYRQHSSNRLGEDDSFFGWVRQRVERITKGDNLLYAKQIEYIYKKFNTFMTPQESLEIKSFLDSRTNIVARIKYLEKTRLYRQTKFETLVFKLLYLAGGYNTKHISE